VHVASADHGVSEALYLWDPDGLGIEVYADRPRAVWKVSGQEIVMTTERLDVRGLAVAGGEQPWTGMPHGTSLGHMHLQVDNLGTADGFYHRALGFDKTVWSFPGALFLSAGGYHHHLGANTWSSGATLAREDEARLLEWEILVPSKEDQDRVAASCAAAGYTVAREEDARVVSDPWNTRLRLLSFETSA
jgi:catechol 2,3-dioxygenase